MLHNSFDGMNVKAEWFFLIYNVEMRWSIDDLMKKCFGEMKQKKLDSKMG